MITTRFEEDLKLLTKEQLTKRYGKQDWEEHYSRMRAGLPIDHPENIGVTPLIVPDACAHIDGLDILPQEDEEAASPPYEGEAVGNFLMVQRVTKEHSGRLIFPERLAGTSDVGWVASVGPECKWAKKGMLILFDQYAGLGRECRLVDENGLPGDFLVIQEPDAMLKLKKRSS